MTKSQNTKNEQLTEQWKKGELPEGVYYVIYYKNDTPEVDIYRQIFSLHNKPIKNFTINQVTKVLAPVPSYDEIVKMEEEKRWYSENLHASTDKINELKELLKECREVIKNVDTYYGNYDSTNGYLVINKIDEALK